MTQYLIVPTFEHTIDQVRFKEAYKGETLFFYTTEATMKSALKHMKERCLKKGIEVTFKKCTKEVDEAISSIPKPKKEEEKQEIKVGDKIKVTNN